MPPLSPDQAAFLLQAIYLPGLRNEHAVTTNVIQAIPRDKSDYRPNNVSKAPWIWPGTS